MTLLDIKQGQSHIAKIESDSSIDGEGVRCSVYISGYPFNCVGCYNKASQKFRYGEKYADRILAEILDDRDHGYISGLNLLGGGSFCNLDITLNLVRAFRARFGNTKTTWVWARFLYEHLANNYTGCRELSSYIDVLVNGLFIQHLFKPDLPRKGSLNRCIIDVRQLLLHARMTEYIVN